jgi:hypothetical protein
VKALPQEGNDIEVVLIPRDWSALRVTVNEIPVSRMREDKSDHLRNGQGFDAQQVRGANGRHRSALDVPRNIDSLIRVRRCQSSHFLDQFAPDRIQCIPEPFMHLAGQRRSINRLGVDNVLQPVNLGVQTAR